MKARSGRAAFALVADTCRWVRLLREAHGPAVAADLEHLPVLLSNLLHVFGKRRAGRAHRRAIEARGADLRRMLLDPGTLTGLLQWLERRAQLESVPRSWIGTLPIAPEPGDGAWCACSQWEVRSRPFLAGGFDLDVRIGGFADARAACEHNERGELYHLHEQLIWTGEESGALRLSDKNVRVIVLREGWHARGWIDPDEDYAITALRIADYSAQGFDTRFLRATYGECSSAEAGWA